ncbi:MAG: ABC transporter substrate-binding protein, partial [Nitrosopumilus sp.]|nr:ABC transporter substrate-binding protein [Nitrosopumilus sp.]
KQIYQGAWNPIMGLTDSYSRQIWGIISDPGAFKHPFTGETFPVRATWHVESAGPNEKLVIPKESILWNPFLQKWDRVPADTMATSKVTFDFKFSNWHNGESMDINDILHSLYFIIEWGTKTDENDKTFDTEFTPRASQNIQSIKGIKIVDEDTIEVYVNYWHFDKGEIADWAIVWNTIPWEITAAMEQAVLDGKMSFSRSGATSKNISWLSLIIPNDAKMIKEYLQDFKESNFIPMSLINDNETAEYHNQRYQSSINWIYTKNHAVISNGPFYLESYAPESRTITVKSFDDESYPFKIGKWSEFENTEFPNIKKIDIKNIVQKGEQFEIKIQTENTDSILFFLTNAEGKMILSKNIKTNNENSGIVIDAKDSEKLGLGANNIKIFAISNSVLKPDLFESSFLVTKNTQELPASEYETVKFVENDLHLEFLIIPIIIIIVIGIYLKKRSSRP